MNPETTKTMKTPLQLAALALLLSTIIYQPSTAFAQGSLTPPGAPAPTMKSADQIEPRTPISSAPFTITNRGSYYLTTNLTVSSGNAIAITTSGVTLDLNGFTLRSTTASAAGMGVQLNSGLRNITIVNGFIESGVTNNGSGTYSGSGFGYGIYYSGTPPVNIRVSGVSVTGCLYYGIYLYYGNSTVVESCTARTVGSVGIVGSTIKSCVAVDCGDSAIAGDEVSDCRGESVSGYGIYSTGTALNCYGNSASGYGLYAYYTVIGCYGYSAGNGYGLSTSTAQNCYGSSAGSGYGLYAAFTAQNCYGSSSSSYGLRTGYSASGCVGISSSGAGLSTYTAQNCYGQSGNVAGLSAITALNCYGVSSSGTGLSAVLADGCLGSSGGTPLSATHPINSFTY